MGAEAEAAFLQLPESLTTSPSQSTFMAEEDASICPLLPNTSSSPLTFNHPLTPSTGNDINSDARKYWLEITIFIEFDQNTSNTADDQVEIDDSSSSSSGIGIGTSYHHLRKNGDIKSQVSLRFLKIAS